MHYDKMAAGTDIKVDTKDKKILYELEKNARQPISQIAKKVKLSKETVNYRIKQLEKKNVIAGYPTSINSSVLGYNLYRLFFKFQNTTPKKEEEIISYLKKIPSIARLCSLEGNWDLTVSMSAKNVFEFKRIYDKFIHKYGKYIEQKYISIATKMYHFVHNILYDIDDRSYNVSQTEENIVKIDGIDERIIKLLKKDCRVSVVELSKKLNLSANAVKHRIQNLVKKNVITSFKIKLNDSPFGYQHYHILLTLQSIDKEKMEDLVNTLIINPNVYFIIEAVGEADLEFEVHVRNSSELYALLKNLRNKFNCIKEHQTILFCRSHF